MDEHKVTANVDVTGPWSTDYPEPPRPSRIDFSLPERKTVRSSDLPALMPGKRGNMTIKRFVPAGFVITEGDCVGDAVAGEFIFE